MTDTVLSSYNPTLNYGNSTQLYLYKDVFVDLIRFGVFNREGGPVPDGASIVQAKVEIYKDSYNYVYRLHPLLKAWDELQATWNVARTGVPWTQPGANAAGVDYASAFDAEFSAPWAPGWMTFDVTDRMRLVSEGASNFGWRVVPVSGYNATRRFYSSEYNDPALRPKLTIVYATGSANVAAATKAAAVRQVDASAATAVAGIVARSASLDLVDGAFVGEDDAVADER
jgi:hypothetical protein